MTVMFQPGERTGSVFIPSSKSQMHRLLICAALSKGETTILYNGLSEDITATIRCLNALGAKIEETEEGKLKVLPIRQCPQEKKTLECGESGSTLRFMLPICGILGADAVFKMRGRLPERPIAPFDEELRKHGMNIRREGNLLYVSGTLKPGHYSLPGNISSQFISGLLMALSLLDEQSRIEVTGKIESRAYIQMTMDVLALCACPCRVEEQTFLPMYGKGYLLPTSIPAEGDYSNAAFFLCLGALSQKGILVKGLKKKSSQGDRAVLEILSRFGAHIEVREDGIFVHGENLQGFTIDAASIPDLIPVLSVVAACANGTTEVVNAGRLRLKESDRLSTTAELLTKLGADVEELEEGLVIHGGKPLQGGIISPHGDHRIAMSAAVAASSCTGEVTVEDFECTAKSYPRFREDFESLGLC